MARARVTSTRNPREYTTLLLLRPVEFRFGKRTERVYTFELAHN